ncbi:hypothetical protein CPB84DRAFT_1753973 [Gymnopilus junonius]|uniref:Uncharacterized protein n=1 Tax=Gymnopilus junonius TaxID=109634 RepID=A0A9P5TFZ8_GYMJU|nr:hypothetical protein CPB84DRAFT_1753973 [Gymnopilus junonius]
MPVMGDSECMVETTGCVLEGCALHGRQHHEVGKREGVGDGRDMSYGNIVTYCIKGQNGQKSRMTGVSGSVHAPPTCLAYHYSPARRTRMDEEDLEGIELEAGGEGNIRRCTG